MIDQSYNQATRAASDDACMKAMPATTREMVERTGLSQDTVYMVIRRLHGKKVHIIGWRKTPRKFFAIYAAGKRFDVPCPTVCKSSDLYPSMVRAQKQAEKIAAEAEKAASVVAEFIPAVPLVEQARRQPNSIWAFAAQQAD